MTSHILLIQKELTLFKVITEYPVAFDSPDHLYPWGTMRDNSTNAWFIAEVLNRCGNQPINFMDLGCSGGQLTIDFLNKGNNAIGLEGSDYSAKIGRANWGEYYNKNLFTCDISRPFQVLYNDEPYKCDCITAWEVIEHLSKEGLDNMFNNILNHLKDDGFFCGTISMKQEILEGFVLHQTVMDKNAWYEFLQNYFDTSNTYDFQNAVRNDDGSFHVLLKKKK